jgi:hypothetical protein
VLLESRRRQHLLGQLSVSSGLGADDLVAVNSLRSSALILNRARRRIDLVKFVSWDTRVTECKFVLRAISVSVPGSFHGSPDNVRALRRVRGIQPGPPQKVPKSARKCHIF